MLPSSKRKFGTCDVEVVNLEHKISLSPFDLISSWDTNTIANVYVTTSARNLLPFHRSIRFNKGIYSSETIRINNVSIPFSSERGYGHNYIYICLPDVIEKRIKRDSFQKFRNLVGSKFRGGEGEWWKPAYYIEGIFQVADKEQIGTPVSLAKILNHSKMGVRANILAKFAIKHNDEELVIEVN